MPKEYEIEGTRIIDGREDNPRCPKFDAPRSWDTIDGVCLHQTGGTGLHLSMWARLVNAHCAIQRDGTILLLQPFDHTIWAVNDTPASKATISVEIEGNFNGALDDPETPQREDEQSLWKKGGGPHEITPEQIVSSDILFQIIHDAFVEGGGEWRRLIAHRQTCGDRPADPGFLIWSSIALRWQGMLPDLEDTLDWFVPYGRPIPVDWDPRSSHPY